MQSNRAIEQKQSVGEITEENVLVDCEGMITVAAMNARNRFVLTLVTTHVAPPLGAQVIIRPFGALGYPISSEALTWIVQDVEPSVDHTGAHTRITLVR